LLDAVVAHHLSNTVDAQSVRQQYPESPPHWARVEVVKRMVERIVGRAAKVSLAIVTKLWVVRCGLEAEG
jgi:hypothetical protein